MRIIKSYIIAIVAGSLFLCVSACKKNFGEINTNPNVVITPDVGFLLTYSQEKMITYQYNEWIWESMEHLGKVSGFVNDCKTPGIWGSVYQEAFCGGPDHRTAG